MKPKKAERIFLDYASATPVLPEVSVSMAQYASVHFANPSALYAEGVAVDRAIGVARTEIARILRAHSDEIVFTANGTEADNLAILGLSSHIMKAYGSAVKPHLVISPFEHSAITEAAALFQRRGGIVSLLPVYEDGRVRADDILKLLTPQTVLVSVMYANNEIGTIQPIKEIAKVIRYFKKHNAKKIARYFNGAGPLFHTDASQAGNFLSLDVLSLGIDMLTIDGGKIYGPKGIGMLYVKRGVTLLPRQVGGGQEGGRRSGTEFVAGIIGLAKALSIVQKDIKKEGKRLTNLREFALDTILRTNPSAQVNGDRENRLPNNINICFLGHDSEFLVLKLDVRGIAVSSSSSCNTKKDDPRSKVIQSLGGKDCDGSSLRITLGRSTTKAHVQRLVKCIPEILK